MYGYKYGYHVRTGLVPITPLSFGGQQLWLYPPTGVNTLMGTSLDGATDALNADALVGDLASTTTGSLRAWIKPTDSTPSAYQTILGFGDTDGSSYLHASLKITTGVLLINCTVGGVAQWVLETDANPFTSGVWSEVLIVQDGVSPVVYIGGSAVDITFTTSTDKTAYFNDLTAVDNARIGVLNFNSSNNFWFNGAVDESSIWTRDLSAAEALSINNSGSGKQYSDLTTAEKVGLVGYYNMNDYLDTSGNANTLTAIGTPTNVAGKVVEEAIAGDNIYQLLDQFPSNNHAVQTTFADQGLFTSNVIRLDGVSEYLNIDAVLTDVASDTVGTWGIWVKPVDATPVSNSEIVSFGDSNANTFLAVINTTVGKCRLVLKIAGTNVISLITDAVAFADATWTHIGVVQNGTQSVIYIDGVAVAQTDTGSSKTEWFTNASGLDNGRIGCLNYNSSGNALFFDGDIQQTTIYSTALSAADVYNLSKSNPPT